MTTQRFSDLRIWQAAHDLALNMHSVSQEFPQEEKYGVGGQLKRSSALVPARIAEGYGKYYLRDKVRLMEAAKSDAVVTQNHLLLSRDLGYIDGAQVDELVAAYDGLLAGISKFIGATSKRKAAEKTDAEQPTKKNVEEGK
ncbi:MAG: four helix bundle protein [Pseudomonadales bacterium]|nr:four helix bundle protein [Candidatus Woesebacteria bacterium]MCB9801747.1 four helix bundle protein [Pseudomonadales bacterium]